MTVPDEIAARFREGDAPARGRGYGQCLHIPAKERQIAARAVTRASAAFSKMGAVEESQLSGFYQRFAALLADDPI